ncbi:hypothetical protein MMC19_007767 [Ptychographa xylographoides]|nr:hypothetical protein [Ptychographa xylographoides]
MGPMLHAEINKPPTANELQELRQLSSSEAEKPRLVLDLPRVNPSLYPDAYLLPEQDTTLTALGGGIIFSSSNMIEGFFQQNLKERDLLKQHSSILIEDKRYVLNTFYKTFNWTDTFHNAIGSPVTLRDQSNFVYIKPDLSDLLDRQQAPPTPVIVERQERYNVNQILEKELRKQPGVLNIRSTIKCDGKATITDMPHKSRKKNYSRKRTKFYVAHSALLFSIALAGTLKRHSTKLQQTKLHMAIADTITKRGHSVPSLPSPNLTNLHKLLRSSPTIIHIYQTSRTLQTSSKILLSRSTHYLTLQFILLRLHITSFTKPHKPSRIFTLFTNHHSHLSNLTHSTNFIKKSIVKINSLPGFTSILLRLHITKLTTLGHVEGMARKNKRRTDEPDDKPEDLTTRSLKRVDDTRIGKDKEGLVKDYKGIFCFRQGEFEHTVGSISTPKELHTKAKFIFEILNDWTSAIRIEIELKQEVPDAFSETKSTEIAHDFLLRIAPNDKEIEPTLHTLSPFPVKSMSVGEEEFSHFAKPHKDIAMIRETRESGHMLMIQFEFSPSQVHDQGVRIDSKNVELLAADTTQTHTFLKDMVTTRRDMPVTLTIFAKTKDGSYEGLAQDFRVFKTRMQEENNRHPLFKWYDTFNEFRPQVQVGMITKPENRPNPNLPYFRSYRDLPHWITTVGVGVVQDEEQLSKILAEAETFQVELRLLKTSSGTDKTYLCLMRCPQDFPVRMTEHDWFKVLMPNDGKEWNAHTISEPFLFSNTSDLTITLDRGYNKETGYSDLVVDAYDLSQREEENDHGSITNFCYFGTPIKAKVRLVHSDKPNKAILAAIKCMNPYVTRKPDAIPVNDMWQRIILQHDLQQYSEANVFQTNIDIVQRVKDLKLGTLNEDQLAFVDGLHRLPNSYGLLKGPPGTGKTHVDITVTMIMMSENKKVLIVSSANDTANNLALKLLEARKTADLESKVIMRAHSGSTERDVISVENARYAPTEVQDPDTCRWTDIEPLQAMYYDHLAFKLIKKSRQRLHGVQDKRYKLHEISLGTLILKAVGLLDRKPPSTKPKLSPKPTMEGQAIDVPHVPQATDVPPVLEVASQSYFNGDELQSGEVFEYDDDELEWAEEQKQQQRAAAKANTNEKIRLLPDEPHERGMLRKFKEFFDEREISSDHDPASNEAFTLIYNEVRDMQIRKTDVLITTLVNSGSQAFVENFQPDLVIFQEGARIGRESLVALGNYQCPVYFSGDESQLRPYPHDTKDNCFAAQLNKSDFEALITNGYPYHSLKTQYRAIKAINTPTSELFYQKKLITMVEESTRPNVVKATNVLTTYGVNSSVAFFNVRGESVRIGPTKTRRNEIEVDAVIQMAGDLIQATISARDITILAPYHGQVDLIRKQLLYISHKFKASGDEDLANVACHTVDSFQGEENSVIILSLTGTEKLGFVEESARLNVATSRAKDSMIIFGHFTSFPKRRRLKDFFSLQSYFEDQGWYKEYDKEAKTLVNMKQENELLEQEEALRLGIDTQGYSPANNEENLIGDEPDNTVQDKTQENEHVTAKRLFWGGEEEEEDTGMDKDTDLNTSKKDKTQENEHVTAKRLFWGGEEEEEDTGMDKDTDLNTSKKDKGKGKAILVDESIAEATIDNFESLEVNPVHGDLLCDLANYHFEPEEDSQGHPIPGPSTSTAAVPSSPKKKHDSKPVTSSPPKSTEVQDPETSPPKSTEVQDPKSSPPKSTEVQDPKSSPPKSTDVQDPESSKTPVPKPKLAAAERRRMADEVQKLMQLLDSTEDMEEENMEEENIKEGVGEEEDHNGMEW